jgi:Tol biopolymer transport system component
MVTAAGTPELLIKGGFFSDEPQISPDGRMPAYISDESGDFEVYLAPLAQLGERVRVFYLAPKREAHERTS